MLKRYGSFFLLAVALGIAPGPDIIFVFAQALSDGWRSGSMVVLGLCTGLCFHVSLAAFGVAAVLRKFPKAFSVITWLGALYLVWLGCNAWQNAECIKIGETSVASLPMIELYARGIIMNVCNPKVMLFFLALMPRFVEPKRGMIAIQFLLLGAIFIVATLLVFNLVAACGGAISNFVSDEPESMAFLQRFSALVMLGLAGWIVWMNRKS